MDSEYLLTFVFTYTTAQRTVFTAETDLDKVVDFALAEIMSETGLDFSGADVFVEEV